MKVLVCGSRDSTDGAAIKRRLSALPGAAKDITIIHGACSRRDPVTGAEISADMLADKAARELGFRVECYPANWLAHGKKAAGPIRNRQMLDRCPDLVLAFQRNRSRGTQDTIAEARRRRIAVEVHEA